MDTLLLTLLPYDRNEMDYIQITNTLRENNR